MLTQIPDFGIGRTRKDDVGVHCTLIAMAANIDGELRTLVRQVEFIGAEQEENIHRGDHVGCSNTALTRHEADIETTHAGSGSVQDREAIPLFGDSADGGGELGSGGKNGSAISTGQCALTNDDQRILADFSLSTKLCEPLARSDSVSAPEPRYS